MAVSEQVLRMGGAFEAWSRGDWEETLHAISPDVVWRPGGFFPGLDPVYEGHDGVRSFWRDFSAPWGSISISVEEVVDDRPGQTLVRARFKASAREGLEVDASFFQLYRYDHEGRVAEFDAFASEADARRAAGLPT